MQYHSTLSIYLFHVIANLVVCQWYLQTVWTQVRPRISNWFGSKLFDTIRFDTFMVQSELPWPIPQSLTMDVHRGSTLITRVIAWCWRYITWRWGHRNHADTITSLIAAKQTVINEVYVFLKLYINFIYSANQTFRIIRIIDFIIAEQTCYRTNFSIRQFLLTKWSFLVHSTIVVSKMHSNEVILFFL